MRIDQLEEDAHTVVAAAHRRASRGARASAGRWDGGPTGARGGPADADGGPAGANGERVADGAHQGSAGIVAVLDVLDCLGRLGSATLSQLARETGIAKSTLHRVCGAMAKRGWLARDGERGLIELGPRAALLACAAPAAALIAAFDPVARALVDRHNETSCLTILDGRDSVFIAKRETTHPVRLVTPVGSRLPSFASASGRAMLARLPREEVDRLYRGERLVTPTGVAIGELRDLHRLLERARERGFAESIDETALGLHCVAVALEHPWPTPAAITFCVPSGRMSAERARSLGEELRAAAAQLAMIQRNPERRGQEHGRKAAA
ncbi:MAG TPA: IclR family transcriptional regulator [Solirubrobacteraceae bacterium]|nr:IclR family transcriptional regulator [Solirubrobacteraceae bacterium]